LVLSLALAACRAPDTPVSEARGTARGQGYSASCTWVQKVRVSSNGALAVVDRRDGGFRAYAIPDQTPRYAQDSWGEVTDVILSSSGTTIALRTQGHELVVIATDRGLYRLPRAPKHVGAIAVSDAGDRVAVLFKRERATPARSAKDNGSVELWSLPAGSAPLASAPVTLYDGGRLTANGSLSRLLVQSELIGGHELYSGLFEYTEGQSVLSAVWQAKAPETPPPIRVVLCADWAWGERPEGFVGWPRGASPVTLPGSLREPLMFAPDCSHLLAYRVEQSVDVESAWLTFRLFDLSKLAEVRRATHMIEDYGNAHFVLTKELGLLQLRTTIDGELSVKPLRWNSSPDTRPSPPAATPAEAAAPGAPERARLRGERRDGRRVAIVLDNAAASALRLRRALRVEREQAGRWSRVTEVGALWLRGDCQPVGGAIYWPGGAEECIDVPSGQRLEAPPWTGDIGDAQCACEKCRPAPAGRYRFVAEGCDGGRLEGEPFALP
jgi:hypothetical protein